jgi:hypothetical protein
VRRVAVFLVASREDWVPVSMMWALKGDPVDDRGDKPWVREHGAHSLNGRFVPMPMEAPLVAATAGHSTAGPAVAGEAVRVSERGGLRGHDRDLVR